jgi:chorismate synthase|tara:strand:- start:63 stop:1148 length:1086 start_codon:yes stop_codon:yes gene_type:complete
MSYNTFGNLFRFTTFGESHGPAIGCIVDGVPPRIPLIEDDIQKWLDKRKPGQSKYTTQRKEPDKVRILSGVLDNLTTGTPISLLIENIDSKSKDYNEIKNKFRPGHADYTYWQKYGIRDYRGGGRSSARETAMRVATGAIAFKILENLIDQKIQIKGALIQIGPHKIDRDQWDWDQINKNPFFCPDTSSVNIWEGYLDKIRKNGLSTGALVEISAKGIPPGLGAPIYKKLDSELANALMSINAVKGIEIGSGFETVNMTGDESADEMQVNSLGNINFLSNHSGGILGGISTGQEIIVRIAIKPTSSILKEKQTIDLDNNNTTISTKGRHDPCVGIRAVPVAEAMTAIVLADQLLLHKAQNE